MTETTDLIIIEGMGLLLTLLFAISFFVRSYSISTLPPELFGDEIDVGYQSFSLFKTGRDLYSQPLPMYVHSLSEWRTPLIFYYTVPTIAAFGNNEWGVRAPEIILGSLTPVILFLLVFSSTKSKGLSLLSSLFISLSPWHIIYSRSAFEVVLLLNFILLGTIFFQRRNWGLSLLFFCLTPYIYSTAVVFTPIWLVCLYFLSSRPKISLFRFWPVLLLIPFIVSIFSGQAAARFGKVGLFSDKDLIDQITNFRSESKTPWERLFSNKATFVLKKVTSNYLTAFSPEFLFTRGDLTARHSLQYVGQLFPILAPFLVLGLVYLIKQRQFMWLAWLIVAPIPSSLTADGGYHATRLFLMLPPLCVAIGAGFILLRDLMSQKYFVVLYSFFWLIFIFQFADAANYYFHHYPLRTWRWWHVGYEQVLTELSRISPEYNQVFINNTYEPSLIRFLFYSRYDPATFQANFTMDKPKADVSPGYYGFFLAPKYYFGGFSPPENKSLVDVMQPGNLYMISQRDDLPGDWDWRKTPPGGIKVLFASTDPTGFPIFYLVTKI